MKNFSLFLLPLLFVSSCSPINVSKSESYNMISSNIKKCCGWNEMLNQEENEYYTYIYSETCGFCRKAETYIEKLNKVSFIYYVLFTESIPIKSERENLEGVDDINSLFILGTPTLFKIVDKKVEKCYVGLNEIQDHVKEVV